VIERIDDAARFAALRDEWTALLSASESDTVFLTWEWLHTWWRHVGARYRPWILAVRAGGELVGLAPLLAKGWEPRRMRFFRALSFLGAPLPIGNVGSDYLDVIVKRTCASAADELGEAMVGAGRVLDLAQIAAGTASVERIVDRLGGEGWQVRAEEPPGCPIVDLTGHTWESYLASRGREHRYSVQRKLRGLRKAFDVSFEPARTEAERQEAMRLLIELHHRRWKDKGVSDAFHTPAMRAFHDEFSRRALERGWLRLFVLRLSGTPAAAFYGLRYGRTFFFFQSGFDPAFARHGVGVATMALSIETAIAEGASVYDMLHGTEEYKFHWATSTRPLIRYALCPPRAQSLAAQALWALRDRMRPVARRVLIRL
jgi:CelD/BcsL family acetyltransferase involved in cellulose biosynthesis